MKTTKRMKTKWVALLLTAIMLVALSCKGDEGPMGPAGPKGEQGVAGDKGTKGDKGPQGDKGDKGDKGAQGDKGDKGDKGSKGDAGKPDVKYVWGNWIQFDPPHKWITHRPTFALFKDDKNKLELTQQTIKDIAAGQYAALCYVKRTNRTMVWTLPAFFANGDFTEFGAGRKMMNYVLHPAADGSFFEFELNVTSTDGTNVKGADSGGGGFWQYRLVFIRTEGGVLKSAGAADALREELQKLGYEEVCARYGIEP